jgi:uncharacterized protein DUF4389
LNPGAKAPDFKAISRREALKMTDVPPTGASPANGPASQPSPAPPFPAVRLLYALGFAVIAWVVFWLIIILGALQFVVLLINGRTNQELKDFNFSLVQYLWELLAFIVFVRDEQPFPIGPFPKHA